MGAIPILVSPAACRIYTDEGTIHLPEGDTKGAGNLPYAEAVRAVAAEAGVACVTEHRRLADFVLEDITVETDQAKSDTKLFDGIVFRNVRVNSQSWPTDKP